MNEAVTFPILVDSPVRFAVVGPGELYPTEIISSGTGNSDFVGRYSLREAGLDSVIDGRDLVSRVSAPSLIATIFSRTRDNRYNIPTTISFDCWIEGDKGRKQLYSLIIEVQNRIVGRRAIDAYAGKMEDQLRILADAFGKKDINKITYIGQIISAFVSGIGRVAEYENRRINREARSLDVAFLISLVFFGIGFIAVVFSKAIK